MSGRALFRIARGAVCGATLLLAGLPGAALPQSAPPSPAAPAVLAPAWGAFENAWTNIASYSATVTVFEQNGAAAQNVVFDYTFKKPSSVTVHVEKGKNAGVTLEWNGGPTLVAHRGSGFAALFKKTYALHDAAVTTIRGSSIDQLSFGEILQHVRSVGGQISQSSGPTIEGVPTAAVMMRPQSPLADAGFTSEVVALSSATNVPVAVLGYDGAALVRRIDFSRVKLNP